MRAAPGLGVDVIYGVGSLAAVCAAVSVAAEHAPPAHCSRSVVPWPDIAVEQDHGRSAQDFLRPDDGIVAFGHYAGFSSEHKHQRPAEGDYRQRFISSIQNECAHAHTSSWPHPSGARGPAALGMSGLRIDITRVNTETRDQ